MWLQLVHKVGTPSTSPLTTPWKRDDTTSFARASAALHSTPERPERIVRELPKRALISWQSVSSSRPSWFTRTTDSPWSRTARTSDVQNDM